MKKPILIICPTRGRVAPLLRMIESWQATTSGQSELVLVADDDDPAVEEWLPVVTGWGIGVRIGMRMGFPVKANLVVHDNPDRLLYMSVDDDEVFRTPGWEERYLEIANSHKTHSPDSWGGLPTLVLTILK